MMTPREKENLIEQINGALKTLKEDLKEDIVALKGRVNELEKPTKTDKASKGK